MFALRPGFAAPVLRGAPWRGNQEADCVQAAPPPARRHRGCSSCAHTASTALASGMEQGLSGKCVETLEPVPLRVSGQVPAWLAGALLRNGPGQFDVPLEAGGVHTVPHW